MELLKHILGFILLVFLLCVGTGRMVATDSAVFTDTAVATDSMVDTDVCVLQSDYTADCEAFQSLDYSNHPVYAELGGLYNQISLSHALRVQRLQFALHYTSLRSIIHRLAMHLISLSKARMDLCDFFPFYRCCPVNQYYIFTLKRILI